MKIIAKKLPGSALLISLLILTGIFIIAFGAGYLSFFNTKSTDVYQQSTRARLAAEAGVERMRYELEKGTFDLYTECDVAPHFFVTTLDDGSYYLTCAPDSNGAPRVQSVGAYKNVSITLDTGFCYDINAECEASCRVGSLCGGGTLFSSNPQMIASPSGCTDSSGANCDNTFGTVNLDTLNVPWDSGTAVETDAFDEDDGRNNISTLENLYGVGLEPNLEAALFCYDLTINGFSDWYLPAKNELNTLLMNSNYCESNLSSGDPVGCAHGSNAYPIVGGFAGSWYETSNEDADNLGRCWWHDFSNGDWTSNGKNKYENIFTRCIRRL